MRNRRELLVQLLDALDAQTFRSFETIIVDDGSTDGADRLVLDRCTSNPSLRLVRSGGAGAVSARRIGVQAASGSVLAFTDSDCIPDQMWLDAGVAAINRGAGLVNGLTLPAKALGPMERSVSSATEGLYPTCNMFYRRDAYDRFGGFDNSVQHQLGFRINERARGTGFGEDTILAWKLIRGGVPCAFEPEALVQHHVFPADPVEWVSRAMQMAAFPALIREVPELRHTLLRFGVYLPPRNRFPVYATTLLLGIGRHTMAKAAFTWWIGTTLKMLRHQDGRRTTKLRWIPAEMGLDAIVAGALVVGSLRSGTVVV